MLHSKSQNYTYYYMWFSLIQYLIILIITIANMTNYKHDTRAL